MDFKRSVCMLREKLPQRLAREILSSNTPTAAATESKQSRKFDSSGFVDSSVILFDLTSIQTHINVFIQCNIKGQTVTILKCCNCDQEKSARKVVHITSALYSQSEAVRYSSASRFRAAQRDTAALNWVFYGVWNAFVDTVWVMMNIWRAFENHKPSYKKL